MTYGLERWQDFWDHGLAYLATAERGRPLIHKFSPEILYNLCALAIEHFFMAFLMRQGRLAEHHTLRALARDAERLRPLPEDLKLRLLRMDRFQEICVLITYQRRVPAEEDVPEFLALAAAVRDWSRPEGAEGGSPALDAAV